jgi:hypothetical protein
VTGLGSYFAGDHEQRAALAVIDLEYGSVASFLVEHGFGPDGRNPLEELEEG